jgi:hypothetical protein
VGLSDKRDIGWSGVETVDAIFAVKNRFDRQYMMAAFPIPNTLTQLYSARQ